MPVDNVWRERELRRAVLAGDELAWRTWYEESFAGLEAYVVWRCAGVRDLAEDVIQETWLTAVRRVRAFDPERGSFANWLRGIAANVSPEYSGSPRPVASVGRWSLPFKAILMPTSFSICYGRS